MRLVTLILLFFFLRASAAEFGSQPGVLVRVWQSQDGLPSNVVRSVVQASDGYLWVATAEGIARFDGFDFELIEPEGELRRYRLAFSRVFATAGGNVWAATYQGGLFRVSGGRLHQILDNIRSPRPPLVTQLIEGGKGSVFFKRGTEFGQVRATGEVFGVAPSPELLQEFEKDLDKQAARGRVVEPGKNPVIRDRVGRVWTAGSTGGLTVGKEGESATAVEFPQRGDVYEVSEMLEDAEGNMWVASPINGLARVRHARVDVLDPNVGQNERAVAALIEDHTGAWWIANRRGGLNRWTPTESRFVEFSNSRAYRPAAAMFEDKSSRLWVASRDGSVFRYDDGVFQPQFSKTQVPSKVRSITQDSAGTLWFGGTQGLASYSGDTVRTFGKASGIVDQDVTVLQPFVDGRIIAGTSSGRILLGDERGFTTIAAPEILRHQWVSGILCVSAKETWVSTLGSGLYLWDGKKWLCFDSNDGLPDSRLTCVLEDGRGGLWLGSLGGIVRAERRELLAHARDPHSAVKWLRLDHTDGMPSRECIGGYQPSGWKSTDGSLWFPTGGGIARVRPGLVKLNNVFKNNNLFLNSMKL